MLTNQVQVSFEVYPPRGQNSGESLESSIIELAKMDPTFISVTFGAGGSSTKNSLEVLKFILKNTQSAALAHLTCVGHSFLETKELVNQFMDEGISDFLALRGDLQPGIPVEPKGELRTSSELVQLISQVHNDRGNIRSALKVAVATFPNGHPDSDSIAQDVQALLAKQNAGADFAITQLFFFAADYVAFVRLAREAGVTIPILPGIMPVTSMQRLNRVLELTGEKNPEDLAKQLGVTSKEDATQAGIDWAANLVSELVDEGAPGVHLYAFNQHESVTQVLQRSGIR
jgi:methylenetetrahydrofolate reductase (NADPH)